MEDNKRENNLLAKRENFTDALRERLETTQIECADAVHIIKLRDRADTFFYCDPPYVGANMGHYAGYMQRDFDALLEQLSTIKGKFLLSSYPNERLSEYTKRHGWHTIEKDMELTIKFVDYETIGEETIKTIEKMWNEKDKFRKKLNHLR